MPWAQLSEILEILLWMGSSCTSPGISHALVTPARYCLILCPVLCCLLLLISVATDTQPDLGFVNIFGARL